MERSESSWSLVPVQEMTFWGHWNSAAMQGSDWGIVEFSGTKWMHRLCQLCISRYGLLVKPLCELLKAAQQDFIVWTGMAWAAFSQLQRALMRALLWGSQTPWTHWICFPTRDKTQHGECCHSSWGLDQGCAYFSQQPDNVSQGSLGCLRAAAAALLLIQKAKELTLGQSIIV